MKQRRRLVPWMVGWTVLSLSGCGALPREESSRRTSGGAPTRDAESRAELPQQADFSSEPSSALELDAAGILADCSGIDREDVVDDDHLTKEGATIFCAALVDIGFRESAQPNLEGVN